MAIDVALLVVGIGLILLRRWAALLSSALAGYAAFYSILSSADEVEAGLSLSFLIVLILTVLFWRTLVWGNKVRDPLLFLAATVISALIHYAAFAIRHA